MEKIVINTFREFRQQFLTSKIRKKSEQEKTLIIKEIIFIKIIKIIFYNIRKIL